MRSKLLIVLLILSFITLQAGCQQKPGASPSPTASPAGSPAASPAASPPASPTGSPGASTSGSPAASPDTSPDIVTTASIVNSESAFLNAIGKNGTWIICLLNDLTTDKELVLEGEFTNGKKDESGKDIIQRKIALYTQDANRNITNRFTLTAPKLTIRSPQASIQHGTFKGDLYVETTDFKLVDTTVDGNIYFASDAAKSGFDMDAESKVTGKQEVLS